MQNHSEFYGYCTKINLPIMRTLNEPFENILMMKNLTHHQYFLILFRFESNNWILA